MSLNEKIALVTGASRGIGREIALSLAKAGSFVIGTATTAEGAEKFTSELQAENLQGRGYVLNVSNSTDIQEVLNKIQNETGAINILVNNAGIHRDNILLRMKQEQWDEVIDTNLNALFKISKICLKSMVKQRWGRIIGISSVVGVIGNPGQVNYAAAKAGMIGFNKSLALEVAAYGITVNTVAPGLIETDMTSHLSEEQREWIYTRIPMKRTGSPEDIANAVNFLASDKASYITGQTLHVNGGMCMV